MCRVCEPGAGWPGHNWNGQALCGGVHREEIYGNTRKGKERESGNEEEKVTMNMRNAEAVGRGIQRETGYFPIMRKMCGVSMDKWA